MNNQLQSNSDQVNNLGEDVFTLQRCKRSKSETFINEEYLEDTRDSTQRRESTNSKEHVQLQTKEGWLQKKSPSFFKGWQDRYCVISNGKFMYYKSDKPKEMEVPQGVFNMNQFSISVKSVVGNDGVCFNVQYKGNDRVFEFRAKTKQDSIDWQNQLKCHIDQSEGYRLKKSAVGQKQPWRFDNVSEKTFMEQADTGDIILFNSSHSGGYITRTATWSHFDHIAIILRFNADPDEVYLLEATAQGVALNKWSLIRQNVGHKQHYTKAVFRHIDYDRNERMVKNLDKLLDEVLGMKYGISIKKLLRRQTTRNNNVVSTGTETQSLVEKQRTFFCSELVAKTFKILGILKNDDTACSKFYPQHFCQRGEKFLKLTDGTKFETEMQIIIDPSILNKK